MSPVKSLILFIFLFFCCLFLLYVGYAAVMEAYEFSEHGIEAEATVLSLESTDIPRRGAITFYYRLKVQDEEVVDGFQHRLSVGETITVLYRPDRPDEFTVAEEGSSVVDIICSGLGGWFWAALAIVFEVFALGMSFLMLYCIWTSFWRVMLGDE